MRTAALLLAMTATIAAAQHQQFQPEFGSPRKPFVETMATPDHPDSHYTPGQTATLHVVARQGGRPLDGTELRFRTGPDMLLPQDWQSTNFAGGQATVNMGTMSQPGFLACQYEFRAADGKTYRDIVKVAYAPEQIRPFTTMPPDFEAFWHQVMDEARQVPLQPEYHDVPEATTDKLLTQRVRLHVGPDKWLQGYLTRPRDSLKHPVVLCPPGAGSQRIYPSSYFPERDCIYLKIEIHDHDQSLDDTAYEAARRQSEGYTHRGLHSRDAYYYKDVYAGCARALDFLCSLPQWDGRNAIVTGGSQGGALTIVTAALNEKATVCAPFYPALCDLTGFLNGRAGGWPKFFTPQYYSKHMDIPQQQAVETLQYYDVVNFARLLKTPTFMSWGYADESCSPTSIWAAWNEIKAPKQKIITPSSGHWRFPQSWEQCWQWITERMQ